MTFQEKLTEVNFELLANTESVLQEFQRLYAPYNVKITTNGDSNTGLHVKFSDTSSIESIIDEVNNQLTFMSELTDGGFSLAFSNTFFDSYRIIDTDSLDEQIAQHTSRIPNSVVLAEKNPFHYCENSHSIAKYVRLEYSGTALKNSSSHAGFFMFLIDPSEFEVIIEPVQLRYCGEGEATLYAPAPSIRNIAPIKNTLAYFVLFKKAEEADNDFTPVYRGIDIDSELDRIFS